MRDPAKYLPIYRRNLERYRERGDDDLVRVQQALIERLEREIDEGTKRSEST